MRSFDQGSIRAQRESVLLTSRHKKTPPKQGLFFYTFTE